MKVLISFWENCFRKMLIELNVHFVGCSFSALLNFIAIYGFLGWPRELNALQFKPTQAYLRNTLTNHTQHKKMHCKYSKHKQIQKLQNNGPNVSYNRSIQGKLKSTEPAGINIRLTAGILQTPNIRSNYQGYTIQFNSSTNYSHHN